MKVGITDRHAMGALSPNALSGYLRARGWTTAPTDGATAVFQQTVRDEAVELDVPLRQAAGDYPRRVAELLYNLEILEERSQLDIYRDILHANQDVIRIAVDVPASGRVGLDEAAVLFSATRDLVLSAACAAHVRRAYFPSRKPPRAMELVRKVRVAAPEAGSFVVVLESPVPAALSAPPSLFGPEEEPYERQVVVLLATAATRVRASLGEVSVTGSLDRFADDIQAGVTANFCDALARILEQDDGRNVALSFAWAAARPASVPGLRRVGFSRGDSEILRAAARFLKTQLPMTGYEIAGQVVRMESDAPTSGGDIVLAGEIDGVVRQVRMTLGADDYRIAVAAHQEERTVSVEGELAREGRSYRLRHPSLFAALP